MHRAPRYLKLITGTWGRQWADKTYTLYVIQEVMVRQTYKVGEIRIGGQTELHKR